MATKRKRKLQRAARAAARRRQDEPPAETGRTFHRTQGGPEMQARQYAAISASYNKKRRR